MDFGHYRNFMKIVKTGGISAAARELLIAQPALSNQIKAMEKEYGAQILKRGARRIELTDAGQILYEKTRLICSLEEMARDEINACLSGNRGTLRLGFTPSYPDSFMEGLLTGFYSLHPHVVYEIHEASSDQIMDLLVSSIIEIGIIRTPAYINPMFKSYGAVGERLVAVFHKKSPWLSPKIKTVPVKLLQGVPLSVSRGFKAKVMEICGDVGFAPVLLSVSSSRPTTLMWVRNAKAVGLVTAGCAQELETDGLCCRPLTGGDMSTKRSFAILKEHNLSAVAQSFLDFAAAETAF
ncbi:MAG: LysR family transcriptional regulator [Acidaminococcales bacterium]|jgi:DNA-binding transcriptional LysR family regulator|nr:LysR family transcriptional regulator [Acidaminococcales bacterium]